MTEKEMLEVKALIDETIMDQLTRLIQKAELCGQMCNWLKDQCIEYPYPADLIGRYLGDDFKEFIKCRDALIAKYEAISNG
jgi:hypothetical protein